MSLSGNLRRRLGRLLLPGLALLGASCGAGARTDRPVPLPTVVPASYTVLSLDDLRNQASAGGVFTGSVEAAVDDEILGLMNEVSRQNLVGYVRQLESFGTRNSFSATDQPGWGIGAAGDWIRAEFERVGAGNLQVAFQEYPLVFQGRANTQRNVVATLPGRDADAGLVIMMANYDTRVDDWLDGESLSPGADDNASGVAALLEVARLMSSRPWPQTVVFLATTAEEQGTFGSRHFVQNALFDGQRIHAALNNDMIGGRAGIPQNVRVFAAGPDGSLSRQLGRYVHMLGTFYLPDFPVTVVDALDREGRWGDHREFVRVGLPSVRLIESEEDLEIQNSAQDTWSLIDFDYLRQVTQLNLVVMANLAATPDPPEAPAVSPAGSGAYNVIWDRDLNADGYAIIFRPINSLTLDGARFFYVGALESGRVALSGLEPAGIYGVSMAALDRQGRVSFFSPEIVAGPAP